MRPAKQKGDESQRKERRCQRQQIFEKICGWVGKGDWKRKKREGEIERSERREEGGAGGGPKQNPSRRCDSEEKGRERERGRTLLFLSFLHMSHRKSGKLPTTSSY